MPSSHASSLRSTSAHPSVDPHGRGRSPERTRHSQAEEHAENDDHRGRSVHRTQHSNGRRTEHGYYHNRDEPKIAEIGDIRAGDCSLLDLYRMWCGVPDYRMLSRADQGGLHKHRQRGEELHLAPWDNGHPGDRHSAQPDWRRFKSSLFHSHAFSGGFCSIYKLNSEHEVDNSLEYRLLDILINVTAERRAMSSYIVVGWITLACS